MSGNGTDMGHIVAMLRDVLNAQQEFRSDLQELRAEVRVQTRRLDDVLVDVHLQGRRLDALAHDMSELRREMTDVRREMAEARRDVAELRQEVGSYHTSVVGHGVLLSELDERLTRVERHLDLRPRAA